MQWLIRFCARGALGLGAAALLLAGAPAHAGPASGAAVLAPVGEAAWQEKGFKELGQEQAGGRVLTPGDASRKGQPLRLAQSTAQPEAAEQLKKRRLQEQQDREKLQQQKMQSEEKPETQQPRKMRTMERQAPAAAPSKPAKSRFGAGVIRNSDPGEAEVE